jgi:pyruvate dehydrogenase E1 component
MREIDDELKNNIIKGGYWLKKPGPNPEIIIVYQGAVASEAIESTALLGEKFKDLGVLSVTSSDNLFHEWKNKNGKSHIQLLLECVPRDTRIITVIDGHPMTLSWIGSIYGHKTIPLGVDSFGQTGKIDDLFKEFTIDTQSIFKLGFYNN